MFENEFFSIADFPLVNEEFYARKVSPERLDKLLESGWRHFGEHFFRYNLAFYETEIRRVVPLRVRLADFSFSKSQRRVFRKNQDLQTIIRPAEINEEKETLFLRHKRRFKTGEPSTLFDFLSADAGNVPCKTLEVCVYDRKNLLAASFFDVGHLAISSIYASFEPREAARSLGIYTMLLEIEYARENGKEFYYQGYSYEGNSFYDYKKRFRALEKFDWRNGWTNFAE